MKVKYGYKLAAAIFLWSLIGFQAVNSIRQVSDRIDELSEAHAGDMLWTISQIETEFHRLDQAIANTAHLHQLENIRLRFDLFYSRISILRDADIFEEFRASDGFSENFALVQDYLDALHLHLDDTVEPLSPSVLTALREASNAVQPGLRELILMGFDRSGAHAATLREATRSTLLQLLLLAVGLIGGLAVITVSLRRLSLRSQRQAGEMLQSKARIQAMVSTALDGILVTTREGVVVETNKAARDMFRLSEDQIHSMHLSELVQGLPGPDFYCPSESGLVNQGRVQTSGKRAAGDIFPAEISLSRLETPTDENPDTVVYVAYIRDISERLIARQTIIDARDKALAGEKAKSKLLAVMNHEIRTPLNGIKGAIELLKDTNLTTDQNRYTNAIESSSTILSDHVENILSLTRLDAAEAKPVTAEVNLRQVIDELIESQSAAAAANKNQLIGICAPEVPAQVSCDVPMLRQVLLNLIGNAIKFTQHGEIRLEVDKCPHADILEFRVSDTGLGISEDELPKLFDDFYSVDRSYSRRQSGLGLGLGIAKRHVQAMRGDLKVESIPNEGSIFWFRLPIPKASTISPAYPNLDAHDIIDDQLPPQRILLVEDNEINRMITGELLCKAGHKIEMAASGPHAISMAEQDAFDVILMDISMPGLDGFETARAIRASNGASAQTPIVALTAQSIDANAPELSRAGMTGVLNKPLSLHELCKVLHRDTTQKPQIDGDAILDLTIIDDLFSNLKPNQIQDHFDSFSKDSEALLEHAFLRVQCEKAAESFATDRHQLAGAAAIFGLSAFSKAVSELPIGPDAAQACAELQPLWEESQAAFSKEQQKFIS